MKAIIIGGGASGIACAITLKQNNADIDVIVLEQLDTACKKILATGNGRCNMTNENASHFELTKDFFNSLGLITRTDSEGRVYPYSLQATSVVDTLLNACDKLDVKIITNCKAKSVEHIGNTYNVFTDNGVYNADVLIIATGGKSQASLGSDGSGYALAKQLGHKVTALQPALVQLKSSSKNCRLLKGLRTKCNVKIENNGSIVGEEYGELLFADYGISGIVVMNLSKHINDQKLQNGEEKSIAIIDFVPEMSEDEIAMHIKKYGSLDGILPKKLCNIMNKQADGDTQKLIKCVKNWRLIITGTKGYDFAQITKGGVATDELSNTNESKLHNNLYFLGELTDNQYDCGGFNLDYAFSSGVIAGNDIYNRYK